MIRPHAALPFVVASLVMVAPVLAQRASRPPLTPDAVADITRLVMLEDTRQLDEATLARLLRSSHPEVRRRAVVAVGRIAKPGAAALLATVRGEEDPDILATVAFSTGQIKDAASIPWLAQLLHASTTPEAVAFESARALGKIQTPDARAALATYLSTTPVDARTSTVVGEALLAVGRFTTKDDIAPIVRWAAAADPEVRWRATWALFRPRNPAATPHLLRLCDDPSPEVRSWAVRGLAPKLVAEAGLDLATAAARLRNGVTDPDRRVRTEALRALVQYDDEASLKVVLAALDSPDSWLSVSAAEAEFGRLRDRADLIVPRLLAATAAGRPAALRITALTPLAALSPEAAIDVASALVRERSLVIRSRAVGWLGRLGEAGKTRLEALNADPETKALIAEVTGRPVVARPPRPALTETDYRQIVERWVVPAYNGAAAPRAVLTTTRGEIEVELHAGDAPLGVAYFVSVVTSEEIIGTLFGRLVPNFVAQQQAIRNDVVLRDEVTRRGLTRGNLSWASSGLDTGRPGYTLGSTPQPHNEGNFTTLGRVVRGMDIVDRLELGDAITGARVIK